MLKTFYIDYNVSIKDQLISIINSYSGIINYLISHEEYNSKGEHKPHFHFFFKVDNIKTFNNCVKNIKETFNLIEEGNKIRKETGKTGYRNYGVLKKDIYDEDYFKQYICKDKNVWGNYPEEQIQAWIDASYKSQTETQFKEQLYKYVIKNYLKDKYKDIVNKNNLFNSKKVTQIKLAIMDYMRENDSIITKTKVNNHFNYFLTKNRNFTLVDILNILEI